MIAGGQTESNTLVIGGKSANETVTEVTDSVEIIDLDEQKLKPQEEGNQINS